MTTDVSKFMSELDGGMFEEKLSKVLSNVAAACIDHESKGEVTIKLGIRHIGTSQVRIEHTIQSNRPTLRGNATEKDTTATPMQVGKGGALSYFPESQTDMFEKEKH